MGKGQQAAEKAPQSAPAPQSKAPEQALPSNSEMCAALDDATREGLVDLHERFGMGLGAGDFRSAVSRVDSDLPPVLAAAFAAETRGVTDLVEADLSAGERMRDRGWALIQDAEACKSDKKADKTLVSNVRKDLGAVDAARDQAALDLRDAFRLTPESKTLVGGEGDLLDEVAAGADWLVEMAIEGDLFWGAFYHGKNGKETSAEAGKRLGKAIAGYPDAVHYVFRVVMQRLPAERRDLDLLIAALNEVGMSTADFPVFVAPWLDAVDGADLDDEALKADYLATLLEAQHIDQAFIGTSVAASAEGEEKFAISTNGFTAIRQLPANVRVAEHMLAISGFVRSHNHMVRYFQALEEVQAAEQGAAPIATYEAMTRHLLEAEAEWIGCQTVLGPLLDKAPPAAMREKADKALPELAVDAMDRQYQRVFDEQRTVVTIEVGARNLIAEQSFGALGEDDLAVQAVEAAGKVEELVKTAGESAVALGHDGAGKIEGLGKILAFYKAGKKLSKAGEIAEEARKKGLASSVETAKAIHELADACAKASAGALETLGAGLTLYGNAKLGALGDLDEGAKELARFDGIRACRAGNRFQSAAKQLGKIGAPGDFLSAAAAVMTLLDADATDEEIRGASFDLASAGVGIAATAAEAAGVVGAGTAGSAVGIGLAYVKLLSDELSRIEALAAGSRAKKRVAAWDNIAHFANGAVLATARAASASTAFRKGGTPTQEKAYDRAVLEAEKRQRWLINQVRLMPVAGLEPGSLRGTPDTVNWVPDAMAAVTAFHNTGRNGIQAVKLSMEQTAVKSKDRALAGGGVSLFEGVRAAGEVFLAQGKRDAE
ncbi:MAG: hypothetical protein EP330_26090 [Deltaproteobacteria bacterium]|nr:MAG: hypothetical protein EP330_26090 [Deltaproteobacteria bacterium]